MKTRTLRRATLFATASVSVALCVAGCAAGQAAPRTVVVTQTVTASPTPVASATPQTETLHGTIDSSFVFPESENIVPKNCAPNGSILNVDISSGSGTVLYVANAANDFTTKSRTVDSSGIADLECVNRYTATVPKETVYEIKIEGATAAEYSEMATVNSSDLNNGQLPLLAETSS